jgi:hypothetical protein
LPDGVMMPRTGGPAERARGTRHIGCPRESHIPRHHPMPQEPVPPAGRDALPAPGDRARGRRSAAWHSLLPARYGAPSGPPPYVRGRSALRVCWDGETRGSWDPRRGLCKQCRASLRASSLEIVGDDAEGTLLLAVVPLPAPAAVAAAGTRGEERVYVIQLTYRAPAAVIALLPRPPPELPPPSP